MNVLAEPKSKKPTPPINGQADQLTTDQRERWEELDGIVRRRVEAFYELGQALAEIRDEHLYRSEFESWEAYCHARLDFSKRKADRLICASKVVTDLGTMVPRQIVPRTESQAHEIGRLRKVEERHDTWQGIVDQHGDAITAEIVKGAVDARLKKPEPQGEPTAKGAEEPALMLEPAEPSTSTSGSPMLFGKI